MTTEQAIDILRCKTDGDAVEALEMSIKALEWQEFVLNGDACATCKHGDKSSRKAPCLCCVHNGYSDFYKKGVNE